MSYDFASAIGLRDAEIAEVERLRTEIEHLENAYSVKAKAELLTLSWRSGVDEGAQRGTGRPSRTALQALVTTIYARPDMQSLLGFTEIEQVKAARAAIEKAKGHEVNL